MCCWAKYSARRQSAYFKFVITDARDRSAACWVTSAYKQGNFGEERGAYYAMRPSGSFALSPWASADDTLRLVGHAMLFEVFANQLPHYLRGREVLRGTQFLERFLLHRVDQNRESRALRFHDESGVQFRYVNLIKIHGPMRVTTIEASSTPHAPPASQATRSYAVIM